ncbi:MAG: hypothetical protein IT267_06095 [Saprospiraceae bacterium]|nr:hypothetical protein [Saprospiraceae bacterium]
MNNKCKLCKSLFTGRSDKKYCSLVCKNDYNFKLRKTTLQAVSLTDNILHRNRSILLEIMGKSTLSMKIRREYLDAKKFNPQYVTQYHLNSQNKMVNYVYDFSWILFSDQEILIKRIRKLQ